jgi:hypothetical protein
VGPYGNIFLWEEREAWQKNREQRLRYLQIVCDLSGRGSNHGGPFRQEHTSGWHTVHTLVLILAEHKLYVFKEINEV